jgi:putative membrane protein
MILPGISGAFILVLLGKYHYVLEAVNQRDLLTLAAVGLGAVAGLVLFARFLTWLFQRRHDMTVALLCGLMAGSLRKIWPFKTVDAIPGVDGSLVELESNYFPSALTGEVVMALLLAAAAAGLVLVLERLAGSRD